MPKISSYPSVSTPQTTDYFIIARSGNNYKIPWTGLIPRNVTLLVTDPNGSALTTGDGKLIYRVPSILNGWTITAVAAHVTTVSSSGTPTIQLRNITDAVDILSTRITIDANEKDSSTAATPAVINAANAVVATADEIAVDVDVAGTGTKGLIVEMKFELS